MRSVNNKLFLEPYKGSNKLESRVNSGFATIKQKGNLVGLKLLLDFRILDPSLEEDYRLIPRGSVLYFSEEDLHNQPWSKKTYECKEIEGKFIIVDYGFVDAIDYAAGHSNIG